VDPLPFEIDPDIARASTPPAEFYRNPAWFARLADRVLRKSWLALGLSAGLERPGAVRPVSLLPGVLGEELALVRGSDEVLRLLSNVCTHRGMLVVEAEGCTPGGLRCRYHGRRFALDGAFRSMPRFEAVEGFPSAADDLPSLPVAERDGIVFGALAPEISFEEWYAPVAARLGGLDLAPLVPDPARHRDYEFDANWALYVDNYLEGFHIPFIHPGLAPAIALDRYEVHLLPAGSVQIGLAADGVEEAVVPPPGHPESGRRIAGWYFWLFPTTMVNVYPWGISLNIVEPLAPARTRVRFRTLVGRPDRRGGGASADLHRVELEDEEVVLATQRGLGGTLYRRGRYSPEEEAGVHHFHRLVLARAAL
jgi:choline monooxygenase